MTIHRTVKELDAGPIAAQEAFPIAPGRRCRRGLSTLGRAGCDAPRGRPRRPELRASAEPKARPTPPRSSPPTASSTSTIRSTAWRRVRALSPHIGARGELARPQGDDLAGAPRRRSLRSRRGAARREAAHELRRVPPRRAHVIAPARAAALRRRPPRLRGGRLRRPGARERRPRGSTRATAPLPSGSPTARSSGRARSTTASAGSRSRPVEQTRPAGPRRAARRRRTSSCWSEAPAYAVVDDTVELVRRAGRRQATGFANAVARRLADRLPGLVAALPPGPLAASYPDWVYELWVRDWGVEEALALMAAQNEPAELVVRSAVPVGDAHRRAGRLPPRGAGVRAGRRTRVAEPRLPARGAGARLARGRADPRCLCRARREGDDAPRRGHRGRAHIRAAPASSQENAARLGATNVHVSTRDVRELARSGFDRALVDAPCSGLGVLARRPDLRWRATPLPELQLELLQAAARAHATGRCRALLGLHDQRRRERGDRRRLGPRARPARATSGRSSRTRSGPSSCSRRPTGTAPPASSSPLARVGRLRRLRGRAAG